jgi:hypothetical protein
MGVNASTGEGQGGGTQTADNSNKSEENKKAAGTQNGGSGGDDPANSSEDKNKQPEKSFTQAELNQILAKERREWEKKTKEAEDRAKLSEDERLKAELDAVKRENQMIKAESELSRALGAAGAKSPELLFAASKERLEFDKDGKLSNAKEIVDELKAAYPTQFGVEKPKESIDGGAGSQETPQGRAENLGDALKKHYQKK